MHVGSDIRQHHDLDRSELRDVVAVEAAS